MLCKIAKNGVPNDSANNINVPTDKESVEGPENNEPLVDSLENGPLEKEE